MPPVNRRLPPPLRLGPPRGPLVRGSVAPSGSAYDLLVVGDNAKTFFPMGDASGHLLDRFGNNTTTEAALTYGVAGIPGDTSTAVSYNGTTSNATVPDNSAFRVGDGPFSVELWVKRAAIGSVSTVITKGSTGGSAWIIFFPADNTIRFARADTFAAIVDSGATTLTDTTSWHHIVATKDGAAAALYLDGVAVTSAGSAFTLLNSTDVLTIGNTNFAGALAKVAIYPTVVLSPVQVLAHYTAGITAAGTAFTSALAAGLSFAGVSFKLDVKPLAGGMAATGGITKSTKRSLAAGMAAAGAVAKQAARAVSGAVSFVGALPKTRPITLSGTVSFVGAQSRQAGRALAGSITSTGAVTRQTRRLLAAGLSFAGSVATSFTHPGGTVFFQALSGGASFTGAAQRGVGALKSGSLTPSGFVTRRSSRTVTAAITSTGALTRRVGRILTGSLAGAGTITKAARRTLTATLSFVGSLAAIAGGAIVVIGGLPPVATARALIARVTGTSPTPGGDATNPRPRS